MIFIQPEISLMRLALVKGSGGVECKQEANKRSLHKIHHPDAPLPHAVITITPQLIPPSQKMDHMLSLSMSLFVVEVLKSSVGRLKAE